MTVAANRLEEDAGADAAGPEGTGRLSLRGQRLVERRADDRLVRALAQKHGLSEIGARLLALRIGTLEEAGDFLSPRLRTCLPDPHALKEMDRAAARLAGAIAAREPIAIIGDYDVDGAASTAMLIRYLRAFGLEAAYHIPHRIDEGYGPNEAAIGKLREQGARLLVTVDCGTLSFEPLAHARAVGFETIVLDHHAGQARRPEAVAFVNPNRPEGTESLSMLAAAGVTFMALIATSRHLRRDHGHAAEDLPDLLEWLDLAALATVCDVVPLAGPNRALVSQGLKVIGAGTNTGLAALAETAGLSGAIQADHLGFQIGPRINAGGRLGDPSLGVRLLTTDDPGEALALAERLDGLNTERRALERDMVAAALRALEADEAGFAEAPVIVTAGEGWHPGILGVVASRLKDRFGKPAIVLGIQDGIAKGSGRSVPGFDLGAAVIEAVKSGLALTGGGHPMAAGLSLDSGGVDALRTFLTARADAAPTAGAVPRLEIDAWMSARAMGLPLLGEIERLMPFGSGNPEPMLGLSGVRPLNGRVVGTNHVSLQLGDGSGARVPAIAFGAADTPLGEALLGQDRQPLDVIGWLKRNEYNGRVTAQFQVRDAALHRAP